MPKTDAAPTKTPAVDETVGLVPYAKLALAVGATAAVIAGVAVAVKQLQKKED